MPNRILIMAHAPLASALRQCALHVFPECGDTLAALDVLPNVPPEDSYQAARRALAQWPDTAHVLVLSDMCGATPCNVARRLLGGPHMRLIAGVNLPMLLRAVSYRHEPLDALVARALAGGTLGVMLIAATTEPSQHA